MLTIDHGQVALARDGERRLDLTLRLECGDVALLVGPNGSGKTTLLDVVAGVRPLSAGTLVRRHPDQPVAYAVQDSASGLLPWRTVAENILFPARLNDAADDGLVARSQDLLKSLRLAGRMHDFPYKLSGGEKQAVNLIRAICTPCSLALIDEILTSLHHDLRSIAKQVLTEWLEERTAIVVTHDPDDLDLPFTRFFAINGGCLEEVDRGRAEKVLGNHV
ncbi:MAG: ABC transporter ATP-binding protein [Nitrospirae bacterium]|nr:ABC transporter ATP-binding protein [Nitrospirota bacterium]